MAEQIMGQPNRAAYERQFGRSGVLQKTRDAGSRKVSKMYQLAMGRLNFGSSKSDSMCESLAAFECSDGRDGEFVGAALTSRWALLAYPR